MTTDTDERCSVAELAERSGWQRRALERCDYYAKGFVRISVLWQGSAVISGGSLYHDDVLTAYTRDLPTVTGWFTR